jgi:hypothetical protein
MKNSDNVNRPPKAPGIYRELPNGDIIYEISTDYSVLTCKFSPAKIKALLRDMIVDLFEKARSGNVPDQISIPGPGVSYLIEIKHRNVAGLAWGKDDADELREEIDFYVEEAFRKFEESLEEKLLNSPPQYMVEILAATMGGLNMDGALRTVKGATTLYEEIFSALLSKFKIRWDAPGSGGTRLTGERLRGKFIDYYKTLKLIAKALKNKNSRTLDKQLQATFEIAKTKVRPDVLEQVEDFVRANHSAESIAWEIATKKYLEKVTTYTRKIMTTAIKEWEAKNRSST